MERRTRRRHQERLRLSPTSSKRGDFQDRAFSILMCHLISPRRNLPVRSQKETHVINLEPTQFPRSDHGVRTCQMGGNQSLHRLLLVSFRERAVFVQSWYRRSPTSPLLPCTSPTCAQSIPRLPCALGQMARYIQRSEEALRSCDTGRVQEVARCDIHTEELACTWGSCRVGTTLRELMSKTNQARIPETKIIFWKLWRNRRSPEHDVAFL